ncbi:MAG: OmpA family protein [Deltaproteobacteria bacterium]|jgi:chemotaxis protein MotB|nr:OmpA family protein [Deltaproteobacteria bacterium]
MAEKKQINYSLDPNAWMLTYTDLMILLLTFFVLLLSLSTVDKNRKLRALNSLVGAFGFKPGAQSVLGDPEGINTTTGSAPISPEEVEFERLRNITLKHGLESDLTMSQQLERTIITLKDNVIFGHKSSELIKDKSGFLSDLAEVLKEGHQLIELRGYSDSSESIMENDPYKTSMFLSSKRAIALFDFFVEKGLSPEDIVAHGFGQNYAGTEKKGKESYLNRQVEIILDYREQVPFKIRNQGGKRDFLDFKGFLFRRARM